MLSCILLASACSDKTNSNKDNNDNQLAEVFEISIMTPLHTAETPEKKVEKLIEEKTNVKLDIEWIPASTYQDRVNTAFATNALADVVNISMEGPVKEAIRDGQF